MALLKNWQHTKGQPLSEKELFKACYPMLLSVMDEIQPMLDKSVDDRQVLAMASMHLGQLVRKRQSMGRRELRKALEKYLIDTFGLDEMIEETARAMLPPLDDKELSGSRILVVDDSAMARRQIQFFLQRDGFDVYEAKSGEEALWLINEVDPDLILMDVSMDGMNGMEACRRIKEDDANTTLPVIFLSAKGEREEIVKGFQSGAIDYIVKPFHPAESLTRIRTHLRVKKLAQLRERNIIELRQLNNTKDRILRVASHDLRNPLAAIAGLAGFLKEDNDNLNESQKEIVECIEESGKSVVALLNELLDVSAINGGNLDLEKEDVDLVELLHNLIPLFKGEAERKNIKLLFDEPRDMTRAWIDRHQIRRVADNLISNAIKFTPANGKVVIRLRMEMDSLLFEVDDSGPGIPPEEANRLFKEFGKTSNLPTGGEKSTGLGLSICQRIVRAHKGTIDFVNLPEGGARFSVNLPAKK